MKKLLSVATATILAAGFAMPLNAAPMFLPKPDQAQADVVQNVRHYRHWGNGNYWRNGRHWNNQYAWRSCRYYGSCYPRSYYGYRNYYPRYYRPYYPGYYGNYPGYYQNYPGYYHPRSGVSIYLNF